MPRQSYDFYLAAPFFNPLEWDCCARIARCLREAGYSVYVPMELHPHGPPDLSSPEIRNQVNDANTMAMNSSHRCIAWVGRRLLPKQVITLSEKATQGYELIRELPAKPDEGTLWEMGWFAGREKFVYMFMEDTNAPLNLMLLQNCEGFIVGWTELAAAVLDDFASTRTAESWKGPVR